MIICSITPEWTSAIISGVALLGTIYTLWSTRKDGLKVQSQVDSLAKLAFTYQKSRRDSINPNFVLDTVNIHYMIDHPCFIILKNKGGLAQKFKIIKATFINGLDITNLGDETTIDHNQTQILNFIFIISNYPAFDDDIFKLIIDIEFMNTDNENFVQRIERLENGKKISFSPIIKTVYN